jgi:hypothetical protein
MINRKIIKALYLGILIILTNCGFSPIYTGDIKPITLFKLEISGDKNLSFDLERKLNFIKDERSTNSYFFKAQIFDSSDPTLTDSRGIPTEENISLTVSYQFLNKDGTAVYRDSITKTKRVSVTDNIANNNLIKNNEKKLLLDSIIQNIQFKTKVIFK